MPPINFRHKEDLVTLDLRTRQIRHLKDYFKGEHNPILFHDLSGNDFDGYEMLANSKDYDSIKKCIRDDLFEFYGVRLYKTKMKRLKQKTKCLIRGEHKKTLQTCEMIYDSLKQAQYKNGDYFNNLRVVEEYTYLEEVE